MWKRECVSVYRTFRVRTETPGFAAPSIFHENKKTARILKDRVPVYALL